MRPDTLGVLADIRDAAQFIAADTAGMTFEEFKRDRRTRQLVARELKEELRQEPFAVEWALSRDTALPIASDESSNA